MRNRRKEMQTYTFETTIRCSVTIEAEDFETALQAAEVIDPITTECEYQEWELVESSDGE
jgi:hypothetical protein